MTCSQAPLRLLPCLSAGQRCNETIGNGTGLAAEWVAAPVYSMKGRLARQMWFSEEPHNGFLVRFLTRKVSEERVCESLLAVPSALPLSSPWDGKKEDKVICPEKSGRSARPNEEACCHLFASQGLSSNPTAWDVPHNTFQWSRCRPSVKRRGLARSLWQSHPTVPAAWGWMASNTGLLVLLA